MSRPALLAIALAAAAALASGCGAGGERVVVLAASSLRPALDGAGPPARHSFASSGTVAAQIRQGADADVAVVADPAIARALDAEGLVVRRVVVARNRLAVLVPRGNPAGIRSLRDLAGAGIRIAVADEGVPLGDATRTALARAGASAALGRVVTHEADAAGVVGKVALGEVDAGVGYASDLAAGRVDGFPLPDAAQVQVVYEAAVLRDARRRSAAGRYLAWLTGAGGRAALAEAGFVLP